MKNHLKIIKDLKSLLVTKLGKDIRDVILYGSQIKGTNDQESDWDVLYGACPGNNFAFEPGKAGSGGIFSLSCGTISR